MNKDLFGRLDNYKFESALAYLKGESKETKDLVKFLAKVFGNSGWILGDMSILIDNALENIGVKEEDLEVD